ncbi:MAG: hypothetical protein ACE5HP_09895 [Gemmatimonadota bacterium]
MWETRPVQLVLHLPAELAEDVEEVQGRDPEYLGKALRYALARRIVFRELNDSLEVRSRPS